MRIIRFTVSSLPEYGVLEPESDKIAGINGDPLFFKSEPNGKFYALGEVNVLCPVIPRSKAVVVSADGRAHLRPNTTVTAPDGVVGVPAYARGVSAAAGLGVVVKSVAKDLTVEEAKRAILGVCLAQVFSAPVAESEANAGGDGSSLETTLLRAHAWDSSLPLGPVVLADDYENLLDTLDGSVWEQVAACEEGDAENVSLAGRIVCPREAEAGLGLRAGDVVFSPAQLVSELSRVFTLLPGDVVVQSFPTLPGEFTPGWRLFAEVEQLGEQEISLR